MMNTQPSFSAQLEKISAGHYLVKGQLSFHSVPQLWSEHYDSLLMDESRLINIDLAQIERSDSSGLALLIEWYRWAKKHDKDICFTRMPKQMYQIAHISGLDELLPLA